MSNGHIILIIWLTCGIAAFAISILWELAVEEIKLKSSNIIMTLCIGLVLGPIAYMAVILYMLSIIRRK